jgi:hypothetical protein
MNNKFHIIIDNVGVEEYDRFLWHMEMDGIHRLFSRLVGFQVNNDGIFPVYQPALSVESRAGQLFIEIHWSRYTSRVLLFDRNGIHSQKYDVREDLDE